MAEGRKPIPGNRQTFRRTAEFNLVGIIEKAMAKNLKARYLNTNKFLHDIEQLEASLEKNVMDEHGQKDHLGIHDSTDHSSKMMTRNIPVNKSKPAEIKQHKGKTINSTLNFGVQLFFGILFISRIIIFMYLLSNSL